MQWNNIGPLKARILIKLYFSNCENSMNFFMKMILVGNKYFDINWMGRKMHTGFPEKALDKYAGMLVDLGYKGKNLLFYLYFFTLFYFYIDS